MVLTMIIYKATNKLNGKCYIGQTRNSLESRKNKHISCARNGVKTHFYCAIRKYGEDNFEWEVIDSTTNKKSLNELETYYITKYDSIKHGYNMVDGGDNNVMDIESVKTKHDNIMRSDEVRKKISESMKKYRKEHPFTDEHRRKLSEKALGNSNGSKGDNTYRSRSSKRKHKYYGNKKVYVRSEITNIKVSHGRSEYDTRSIACYCIDEHNKEHHFYSYLDAGKWWYEMYKPFPYSTCTYQRKIKQSIKFGYATYCDEHSPKRTYRFDNPKWFIGGDRVIECDEVLNE